MPSLTEHPHQEPMLDVSINGKEFRFMVDTGATYSCIGTEGSHLPLSRHTVKMLGFSGTKQLIPRTEPVPLKIQGQTIFSRLLVFYDTPVNLMGRDILSTQG